MKEREKRIDQGFEQVFNNILFNNKMEDLLSKSQSLPRWSCLFFLEGEREMGGLGGAQREDGKECGGSTLQRVATTHPAFHAVSLASCLYVFLLYFSRSIPSNLSFFIYLNLVQTRSTDYIFVIIDSMSYFYNHDNYKKLKIL